MVIYLGFWSLFIQMLFSSIRFLFPQISIVHRLSPPPLPPPPPATALQTLNQPPSSSKRQSESCVLFPSKRRNHSYISVPDPLSWSQHDHPMTAWMSACLLSLSKTFFSTENEDNSKVNIITAFIENYLPVFVRSGQSIFAMFISWKPGE